MCRGREIIEEIRGRAKKNISRIVFPESSDERIIEAAKILKREGIVEPILVAKEAPSPIEGIQTVSIKDSTNVEKYIDILLKNEINREMSGVAARRLAQKPMAWAALMTAAGDADGMVAGCVRTTALVVLAAKMCIGMEEGIKNPSSFLIIILRDDVPCPQKVLVFADAAVSIKPGPEELAMIAILTCENVNRLMNIEPNLAFLSFSSKDSAQHEDIDKVKEAVRIAREKRPDLNIDGELQFDAAVMPDISRRKAADSPVAGKANILIFPDLNSANIGYKIAQYAGGAIAVGPVMQGFKRPVNDLSRGATVDDIVTVSAIVSLFAKGTAE